MTTIRSMLGGRSVHWTGKPNSAESHTPQTFTLRCGGCGAELDWPAKRRARGTHLRCPECSRHLRLPKAQRAGCPSCGKLVSRALPPRHPKMQCGHCGVLFQSSPPMASAATRRAGRSRRGKGRTNAVALMVSFSAVLGFVLLCLLMWFI